MSNKMTCPVCDSHTSGVWLAMENGDPCPHCGAPADVMMRVEELRRTRADDALKAELTQALVDLGKVTAERDRLARIVGDVRTALDTEEKT